MSITDRLRKAFNDCTVMAGVENDFECVYITKTAAMLCLDEIDAEHEKELAEQYASLTIDMEPMTDENMAKRGWMRLPEDADGKPIHVGDVVIYDHDGVRTETPETVEWIAMGETEVHISTEHHSYTKPSTLRHHREPTIEDVLREFAFQIGQSATDDDIVTEYAEKLREVVEHDRD